MENLYVKLAAYREIETERLRLRPVTLEDATWCLSTLLMKPLRAIRFQPIKVWKKRVITLPFFTSEPTLEDGDRAERE